MRIRAQAQGEPSPALHRRLALRDPQMAERLKPGDRQRILRALEVHEATGCSLAEFQGRRGSGLLDPAKCLALFLAPERSALYARINARFEAMMHQGALEEVRALGARGLDPALPCMRAHGVPGLLAFFTGQASLEEAIIRGQTDTRHYAKRQFTWFRHQLAEFRWIAPEEALAFFRQRLAGDAL